jgi:hypothetical protein
MNALAQTVIILLLCFAGFCLYFLPTFIAGFRKHHNVNAILALNLFAGWTFFGWVAALVWSFAKK